MAFRFLRLKPSRPPEVVAKVELDFPIISLIFELWLCD